MANRLTKGVGLFGALFTNGRLNVSGPVGQVRSVANVADGAAMAVTAAQVVTNRIVTATLTEARNAQLPTAASIIALVGGEVGQTYEFSVINLTAATHDLTLTVNTGLTFVGSVVVGAAASGRFGVRVASGTTVVVHRLS